MKIQTYRELESKNGLVPLLDHAFNWVFNQKQFDDFIKIDPRIKNGPVSYCAIDNDRIIGHVGVMELKTRTVNGNIEHVGGLYGVATLPSCTRKGVCTALIRKAHEHFSEKHYKFSLLSTSPSLVAHSLYLHLGYSDLVEYPTAYKAVQESKTKRSSKGTFTVFNPDEILRIYDQFVRERTGLVVRDRGYLKMLRKIEGIKPKHCIIDEKGYVIFRSEKTGTWIRELVALNKAQKCKLLDIIEDQTRGPVYDRAVLDSELLEVYGSRGYMTLKRGYGVMMFKPLNEHASLAKTYGDGFFFTRLDSF
jgi:predicted acetyltransferase